MCCVRKLNPSNDKQVKVPKYLNCKSYTGNNRINILQVVSSDCLSDKKYQLLVVNKNLKKIWYSDYSNRVAYFIFE